jgi:2-dehydro-3-deoxyphosphooctonate aldolase (KDO 8-P synthase)
MSEVMAGNCKIGGGSPLVLIAGPDVIESHSLVMETCEALIEIAGTLKVPLIFKSSLTKANRSSGNSYSGPGLETGLTALADVKAKFEVPVTTDIHETGEVEPVSQVVDLLQIPAFLCRQTPLALAAAASRCAVNIKKGQFMKPAGMHALVSKITDAGNPNVMVTERGTTFGYNDLVVDMRGLAEMSRLGTPVIFDVTHSTQLPGAAGDTSGGERKYAAVLARAAIGAGVAGLFCEVHPDPPRALCDAEAQLTPQQMRSVLEQAVALDTVRRAVSGEEARALITPGEEPE